METAYPEMDAVSTRTEFSDQMQSSKLEHLTAILPVYLEDLETVCHPMYEVMQ